LWSSIFQYSEISSLRASYLTLHPAPARLPDFSTRPKDWISSSRTRSFMNTNMTARHGTRRTSCYRVTCIKDVNTNTTM
jgi:hypothetical protein